MNIISCKLDSQNEKIVLGTPLGTRIKSKNKPCLWSSRSSSFIDTVVIHYISAGEINPRDPFNTEAVLSIFPDFCVSSHYLILREGTIYSLVPEEKKGWHCGGSIMPAPDDRTNVNEFSIGIELVATYDSGFTDKQYAALNELCIDIKTRWPVRYAVGHSDIAGEKAVSLGLRNDLKHDPGPCFDWGKLCVTHSANGGNVHTEII